MSISSSPHQGVTYVPHVILINLSDSVQKLQMSPKARAAGRAVWDEADRFRPAAFIIFFFSFRHSPGVRDARKDTFFSAGATEAICLHSTWELGIKRDRPIFFFIQLVSRILSPWLRSSTGKLYILSCSLMHGLKSLPNLPKNVHLLEANKGIFVLAHWILVNTPFHLWTANWPATELKPV